MTKEQEESIDYVQKQIDYFKKQIKFIEAVDRTYYESEYRLYKNRVKQFETVLNMLKEKDNIINEQLKENVELRKELNEENKRCMILANNDKFKEQVIDLMALAIINYDDQLVINRYKNINEVKQCFERKVRE